MDQLSRQLIVGLAHLQESATLCDVYLKATDSDHQSMAHSCVLAAYSPHLRQIFESNQSPETPVIITCQGLTATACVNLLKLLYSIDKRSLLNELSQDSKQFDEVLYAASVLQIKLLQNALIATKYQDNDINHSELENQVVVNTTQAEETTINQNDTGNKHTTEADNKPMTEACAWTSSACSVSSVTQCGPDIISSGAEDSFCVATDVLLSAEELMPDNRKEKVEPSGHQQLSAETGHNEGLDMHHGSIVSARASSYTSDIILATQEERKVKPLTDKDNMTFNIMDYTFDFQNQPDSEPDEIVTQQNTDGNNSLEDTDVTGELQTCGYIYEAEPHADDYVQENDVALMQRYLEEEGNNIAAGAMRSYSQINSGRALTTEKQHELLTCLNPKCQQILNSQRQLTSHLKKCLTGMQSHEPSSFLKQGALESASFTIEGWHGKIKPGGNPRASCTFYVTNSNVVRYVCSHCNYETRFSAMARHLMGKHMKALLYDCQHCDLGFCYWQEFLHHYKMVHASVLFTCNLCQRSFQTKYLYEKHMFLHGENKDPSVKVKRYVCQYCGKEFMHTASYHRHLKYHADYNMRTHLCSHCGKKFVCARDVEKHEKIHTSGPSLTCDECGFTTNQKGYLLSHVRRRHGVANRHSMFYCLICSKSFQSKPACLQHLSKTEHAVGGLNENGLFKELFDVNGEPAELVTNDQPQENSD